MELFPMATKSRPDNPASGRSGFPLCSRALRFDLEFWLRLLIRLSIGNEGIEQERPASVYRSEHRTAFGQYQRVAWGYLRAHSGLRV